MTNSMPDDFEDLPADAREHMRRFHKPDGICIECGQPADQHHPVGPITIKIKDGDGNVEVHEFCNWVCLGNWAETAAGGVFVVDRN